MRFGVNRHTVRRALADMSQRGLLHVRRGSGAFVAAKPTNYSLGRRVRFHQNLAASGQTAAREILHLETRASNQREAEALRLTQGDPVHVCEGISLADGAPIAVFRSVFPAARLPNMPARLREHNSVTAALAAEGVPDYTRASTRLTAKVANPVQAVHLRIAEGAPILRTVSINVDAEGVPVEFGRTWFAGDRVTLTVMPE